MRPSFFESYGAGCPGSATLPNTCASDNESRGLGGSIGFPNVIYVLELNAASNLQVEGFELKLSSGGQGNLLLNTFLLMHRLSGEGEAGRALAQALAEAMTEQLDDDMRQMGVSDVTVPKKIRKAASAAYGRFEAYAAALEANDPVALGEALIRNVYDGDAGRSAEAARLADHMMGAAATLRGWPSDRMMAGDVDLPHFGEIEP